MYSDFVLFDQSGKPRERWERLPLGRTGSRDEAWLRDLVFANPDILPLQQLDPSFGPLIPLCTELRTEAGPVDAAFINRDGKLTIVECKLWRNPQARREVVAQILDYARALSRWSYADLQRQTNARLKSPASSPFALAQSRHPDLNETDFVDSVHRSLRSGRFLLIILGDGIREDVESLAELVNRNAASGFQLGIIEAALYGIEAGSVAVQTRVIARTALIERVVFVDGASAGLSSANAGETDELVQSTPTPPSPAIRDWWAPVLAMQFDDPEQPPPVYFNNNVRAALPWPGLFIGAYRTVSSDDTGVFLGGRDAAKRAFIDALGPDLEGLRDELSGALIVADGSDVVRVNSMRKVGDFASEDEHRSFLIQKMNEFCNALRPRMKRLQQR